MEQRTPFYDIHNALGAKMVPFAGFEMPVSYTSITDEHLAVRKTAGLFDVSHMGQFIVKGKEALDLVQKVTSNNAAKLNPGEAQYSCFPNANGGVIDDLIVYRLFNDQCAEGEQAFMLVVNASNIEKDWNWINAANNYDTRLIDISKQTSLLALQGPKASEVLQHLTDTDLGSIPFYHFTKGSVADCDNVLISATGYTGAGGFELYFDSSHSQKIWSAIMKQGESYGLKAAGLGARDTLRLEKGYCLYGHELGDDISPIEAGLGWIVKTKKGSDFFSKAIFQQQRTEGVKKKLIGFKMFERRIPRQGYTILNMDDKVIGEVTSGTMSPSLEEPIGMGYIEATKLSIDKIKIGIRKKSYEAQIVKLPFV